MNEQKFIISELGLLLLERFTKNRDLVILSAQIRAKPIVDTDNEKLLKLFDHMDALCDEIIEKHDPQSKWGFNALLIKHKMKDMRKDNHDEKQNIVEE